MKLIAFIVALVAFSAVGVLLNLDSFTGNVARYPQPYPGIDALTLHGHIVDANGEQLPPGNIVVTDQLGNFIGVGGLTLVDYTVTLIYGWHEFPPTMHVYYTIYEDKVRRFCTTINLHEVLQYPSYDYTVYINLQCGFEV